MIIVFSRSCCGIGIYRKPIFNQRCSSCQCLHIIPPHQNSTCSLHISQADQQLWCGPSFSKIIRGPHDMSRVSTEYSIKTCLAKYENIWRWRQINLWNQMNSISLEKWYKINWNCCFIIIHLFDDFLTLRLHYLWVFFYQYSLSRKYIFRLNMYVWV